MKKNAELTKFSKTIILSAAAALAFGAVAVGTTYALFTSEAGAEVSVVFGKVSLKSEIFDLKLYSLDEDAGDIVEVSDAFTNGGTATISGSSIALDKITPGDKAEFTIKVTNESNVDIKYRRVIKALEDDGLKSGLEIKVDGIASYSEYTNYTEWSKDAEEKTVTLKVSVALPKDAGNEYQEKKCKLSFLFEAVQKNAQVESYYDTLEEAFGLDEGTFGYNTAYTEEKVLDGKGLININKWVDGYIPANTTIKGVTFLNGATFAAKNSGITFSLEDCTFYACDQSKLVYTTNNSITNSGAGMCLDLEKASCTNISYNVKNCTFVGENDESLPAYGNKYNGNGTVADAFKKRGHAIGLDVISGGDSAGGSLKDVTIEGCEISGVRGNAIQLYGLTGNITIKDTKINSWGINSGNYTIKDGTIKDGNSAAIRGDYATGGARKLNLDNIYFGLNEGEHGSHGVILTHVNVGSYAGNTSTDDSGTRVAGTYSYTDE